MQANNNIFIKKEENVSTCLVIKYICNPMIKTNARISSTWLINIRYFILTNILKLTFVSKFFINFFFD